jgi:ribonuclease HI
MPTFDPVKLVKYSPKCRHARLMNFPFPGSHFRPRMRSVVVAVDGGSRGNNQADPTSRAAWGVYWGPSCAFNYYGVLASNERQTSGRAELQAVRYALIGFTARRIQGELDGWRELVIKLDSEYVKKSFDEYIWKWETNGWRKSDGKEVEHLDLIRDIHRMICNIEQAGAVRF